MLKGAAEGVLQSLVNDDHGSQILVRVDIVVIPGIGRNLFSVMTAAKKSIATIFDHENPRLEGFNVTVPLPSESQDLYSFVPDMSVDRYGAKELAINAVANARQLDHLHAHNLGILRRRDDIGMTFVSNCDVCTVGKDQQLAHSKTATHEDSQSFQLCYEDQMEHFTPVAIGGYSTSAR